MRNYTEEEINVFLNQYNYDVRESHDARWIDQKCTMDVVSLVADCILQFVGTDRTRTFTVSDIWHSKYTVENVQQIFSKPNPDEKADNEYDKYFGQPIKLLGYSKILKCETVNKRNYFTISNYELLEYLSIRERNAFLFLCCYIEKVLKDSGIFGIFSDFLYHPNDTTFLQVKKGFSTFTISNTPINGETECNRIFIKVLNPLACKYKTYGTYRGRLSKDIITFDMIAYNQRNWRDLYSEKPKNMTRAEYEKTLPEQSDDNMTIYRINKAKRFIRSYNDKYRNGKTELYDKNHIGDLASQMHHIFPVSYYPEIADFYENLIALTPTQHFSYAHPQNNTKYVDSLYQYHCLIAKCGSIRENIVNTQLPTIYHFDDFIFVLNTGLETDEFDEVPDMDFNLIMRKLDYIYDLS